MLSRVLIANRGEIALRIIRACRELDIETVAVYSEADRGASYVQFADESVCIGPPDCNQSYLNIPRIISAAEITNVDAIHPGYGFLAENINFAEICRDCGIVFIGPPVEAMRLLGDKVEARKLARKAKVPTVPGSEGTIPDETEALKLANEIGYPVIIKAVAGGGGRGMRVVHNDISLRSAYSAARTEAEAAFGESSVYIEKFITEPRHVEVQVLADRDGNALHFYERDCSIQRRHQKMIEESPCPALEERDRQRLAEAALRLIKDANYVSAATVEFLLDKDKKFYFIEANTRIQVEHPVTEMGSPAGTRCVCDRRTSSIRAWPSNAESTRRTRPTISRPVQAPSPASSPPAGPVCESTRTCTRAGRSRTCTRAGRSRPTTTR